MAPRRVVVDRVDAAVLGDGARHEVGHRLLLAHVAAHPDRPAAGRRHLLGHRGRTLGRHVADRHRGAGGGQPQRGGAADVRGATADEHDLAVELSPSGAMGPS